MTNRYLLDTLNSFIPGNSYTLHYKIVNFSSSKEDVERLKGCDEEAKKYRQAGYKDIPITMPNPTDDSENIQIYQILHNTNLRGIWLDFQYYSNDGGDKKRSMRNREFGHWSDNEETDNGLMCVFVDYTDLTNSVCTTVSLISHSEKKI